MTDTIQRAEMLAVVRNACAAGGWIGTEMPDRIADALLEAGYSAGNLPSRIDEAVVSQMGDALRRYLGWWDYTNDLDWSRAEAVGDVTEICRAALAAYEAEKERRP